MSRSGQALDLLLWGGTWVAAAVLTSALRSPELPWPAYRFRGSPLRSTPDPSPETARRPAEEESPPEYFEGTIPLVPLERLAFPSYDPPTLRTDPSPLDATAYPAAVRDLDGRTIALRGHPLVLEYEGSGVRQFLLTRFPPGCCFGSVPILDEWVQVELEDRREDFPRNRPTLIAVGAFEVREHQDEDGQAVSLYRLRAARLGEE